MALTEHSGDIVNGTRLVYPTEKGAMRFLNHMANHWFAIAFTWLLKQHVTDTLCGTKAFWKQDYLAFERQKRPQEASDKYGDYFLLLHAYQNHLKIVEVPVRYTQRKYGDTKLNRLKNGWQFLQMLLYFFFQYKVKRQSLWVD